MAELSPAVGVAQQFFSSTPRISNTFAMGSIIFSMFCSANLQTFI